MFAQMRYCLKKIANCRWCAEKSKVEDKNIVKKIKIEKQKRYDENTKNEHVSNKEKSNTLEDNNNCGQNKEAEYKTIDCRRRYVFKILKEKRKNNKQERRNLNRFQKNTNVKDRKVTKKLHLSSIFKKQNLANTLKSYAMSNLRTKYRILQKVKILQQKHTAKGINMNRESSTLTQCLNIFNQKTCSGPIYVCTVCLQTWFRTSVHDVANLTFKHISSVHRGMYLLS